MSSHDKSKRKFIKTAAYVAPAILTLKAMPAYAGTGSGAAGERGSGPARCPDPGSHEWGSPEPWGQGGYFGRRRGGR